MAETTKQESTAVSDAIDRKFSAVERLLDQIGKHGFATVAVTVLTVFFLIPMRDGHLRYLEETSGSMKTLSESSKQTGEAMEKTADAADAIKELVEHAGTTSTEHFATSKDTKSIVETTAEDVKQIKAAVVPK